MTEKGRSKNESAIGMLRRVYSGAVQEGVFQIPLPDGKFIEVKLTTPDIVQIWEDTSLETESLLIKAQKKGLGGMPIDRKEWEEDISKMSPEERKRAEENEPKDRAEQFARKHSGINILRSVVPRYIRNMDGTFAFPSPEDQSDFAKIMFQNDSIMKAVSNAYLTLTAQIQADRIAIKN